jgi:hypothetical protein
VPNAVFTEFK